MKLLVILAYIYTRHPTSPPPFVTGGYSDSHGDYHRGDGGGGGATTTGNGRGNSYVKHIYVLTTPPPDRNIRGGGGYPESH